MKPMIHLMTRVRIPVALPHVSQSARLSRARRLCLCNRRDEHDSKWPRDCVSHVLSERVEHSAQTPAQVELVCVHQNSHLEPDQRLTQVLVDRAKLWRVYGQLVFEVVLVFDHVALLFGQLGSCVRCH